jgi:type IX secretion system PorP/SprF family membrane protein
MRKIILYIIPVFFLGLPVALQSQQIPVISQYVMNKYLVNPALAGVKGYTNINFTARQQYSLLENAPRTFILSGETRLLEDSWIRRKRKVEKKAKNPSRNKDIGIGGYFFNDRNGIINRTGMQVTYAYHINFENQYQLSFGLSVSAYQFNLNTSNARIYNIDDPLLNNNKTTFFVPDANAGIYVSGKGLYAGLSAAHLFGSHIKLGQNKIEDFKTLRHFYLIGGYKWLVSHAVVLEPSFLARTTVDAFVMDATLRLFYQTDYWIGASYRTNKTLAVMAGFMVEGIYLGYAYDATLGALQTYSGGSHELMVGVRLGDNSTRRSRWLRPDVSEIGE